MKRNTASQIIGCQLVSAAAGAAVTSGTTTVYVTGDGGTQAAGSVGSGACTHEGQGFWTYAPAQAETDYAHVAFTFTNATAIPVTVQVFPTFPQTGDNFARLGAPAGASVSADVAAVKAQTAAIEVDTQDLQARTPAALVSGRMDSSTGAMAANVLTAAAINADAITAAKVAADVTTEIQSGLATAANLATVAGYIDTEVASILAAVDTEVAAIKTVVDDILVDTAVIGALGAGLTALATQSSVDDLPTNAELATALGTADDAVLTAIGDLPTNAELATALAAADDAVLAAVATVQSDTNDIQARLPDALVGGFLKANIKSVNDVVIEGDGAATPWGPA